MGIAVAKANKGLEITPKKYPVKTSHFLCPNRSAIAPEKTFVTNAAPSPTPSTKPIQIMPAPNVLTIKRGSRAWIISEEISISKLTHPNTQTVLGIEGFERLSDIKEVTYSKLANATNHYVTA